MDAAMKTCDVRLPPALAGGFAPFLLPMLASMFPLRFTTSHDPGLGDVVFTFARDKVLGDHGDGRTSLTLAEPPSDGEDRMTDLHVSFTDSAAVPAPFRGRRIATKAVRNWRPLPVREGETVLATVDTAPIWTRFQSGASSSYRSAFPLPEVTQETCFADVFNADRFLDLLPLIYLLRDAIGHRDSDLPPLRATFIVDDPNLHHRRYGFVDYGEVAVSARKNNYHVSFATIPLDTWLTSERAARIFRESRRSISMLVHGNNHGRDELAKRESPAVRIASLRQALARIERLERKARLHVSRVMVPPHGACTADTLALLPLCGFDAACVSTGSLRFHNQERAWTRRLGFLPCDVIEGCPVLPRSGLTGNIRNALLLAAFLGQPLIARGHHQDFRHGCDVFDDLAAFVNGFGDVRWLEAGALARMNFTSRMNGSTCRLKPLSLRLEFTPPSGARELEIDDLDEDHRCGWQLSLADGTVHRLAPGARFRLDRVDGSPIALRYDRSATSGEPIVRDAGTRPALVLRRLLTEARDRLLAT